MTCAEVACRRKNTERDFARNVTVRTLHSDIMSIIIKNLNTHRHDMMCLKHVLDEYLGDLASNFKDLHTF